MWGRKQHYVGVPNDLHEARRIRDDSASDLDRTRRQETWVNATSARLMERRAINHFGDDITLTFKPRGRHDRS